MFREGVKKVPPLVVRPLRGGRGGVKAGPLRKTTTKLEGEGEVRPSL